jgi:hypothetical protein
MKFVDSTCFGHQHPPTPHLPANKKWATFTYTSPEIRKITNIFKRTDINIVFKCHNTIAQLSKPVRNTPPSFPCDKSGVYAISCVACGKAYVGQTSRSLSLRFKEHARYIRHNNPQSAYALHILQHQHEYRAIDKTMTLLKTCEKHFPPDPLRTVFHSIAWPHGKTHPRAKYR